MKSVRYVTYTRVIVCCRCGLLPLNDHANAQDAWTFAAAHVALNPSKCVPTMHKDSVDIPVKG